MRIPRPTVAEVGCGYATVIIAVLVTNWSFRFNYID